MHHVRVASSSRTCDACRGLTEWAMPTYEITQTTIRQIPETREELRNNAISA